MAANAGIPFPLSGDAVGVDVGSNVGCVGAKVGSKVGCVGARVGFNVGTLVGRSVVLEGAPQESE